MLFIKNKSHVFLASLLMLGLSSCGGSNSKQKEIFLGYCSGVQPLLQMKPLLGQDRIDGICSCAYDETKKYITDAEMKKGLSSGAGLIDPEVLKVSTQSARAISTCIERFTDTITSGLKAGGVQKNTPEFEACVSNKVASLRKEIGEDAPIKYDVIEEFESLCREGK